MLDYLWRWFVDLTSDRDAGFGVGYIKSSEYEAWARLNRLKISPSELAILKRLDRAFVRHQSPEPDPPQQGSGLFKSLQNLAAETKKGGKP